MGTRKGMEQGLTNVIRTVIQTKFNSGSEFKARDVYEKLPTSAWPVGDRQLEVKDVSARMALLYKQGLIIKKSVGLYQLVKTEVALKVKPSKIKLKSIPQPEPAQETAPEPVVIPTPVPEVDVQQLPVSLEAIGQGVFQYTLDLKRTIKSLDEQLVKMQNHLEEAKKRIHELNQTTQRQNETIERQNKMISRHRTDPETVQITRGSKTVKLGDVAVIRRKRQE